MQYSIETTASFDKEAKRLIKRYPSFKQDYLRLLEQLKENPQLGIDLGNGLRKIRLRITSKGRGKSGGARVLTYTVIVSEQDAVLNLLYIFDKADRENLPEKEIESLLKQNGLR
ncbi:MAG: type II toxin-antitoxin system RelE/ParE family toxin [Mediterranea sp.]|jgi:hypothetical protein|nr:type II toxin-antitoxin system RelE/ParE family toxin [Mediterranea sp.]